MSTAQPPSQRADELVARDLDVLEHDLADRAAAERRRARRP